MERHAAADERKRQRIRPIHGELLGHVPAQQATVDGNDAHNDVAVAVSVDGLIDGLLHALPALHADDRVWSLVVWEVRAVRIELQLHGLLLAESIDDAEIDGEIRCLVRRESDGRWTGVAVERRIGARSNWRSDRSRRAPPTSTM